MTETVQFMATALERGRAMRTKQEAYLRLRTREAFIEMKQAEREFDRVASEALRRHDEEHST